MNAQTLTADACGERPKFQTLDPTTGANGKAFAGQTETEALAIARSVKAAQAGWRRTSFAERARLMREAAAVGAGTSSLD
jgi:succinate-semialdehyde dehydrogenase/glutarate-semialdehyde dehydrogenase